MLSDVLATTFGRTCSLNDLVQPDALEYQPTLPPGPCFEYLATCICASS